MERLVVSKELFFCPRPLEMFSRVLGNQWLVQKQDKGTAINIPLLPNPAEKMARLTCMCLHNFFLLSVTLNPFLSSGGRKTQGFEGPIQRAGWQSILSKLYH